MNPSSTSLERFVRRVYRRLVVLRLLEWAGIGFAIACGVSLLSIVLLRNRTESPLGIAAIVAGGGAAGGFFGALLRRPKNIDAALGADRPLELAELLGTRGQWGKTGAWRKV